ncbi:Hypothetical protein PHPALM_16794 [Phytophthora palmivora]|uniref:Uncharacterized protein n=1 Tax=Phytophthora palmivora TaxID=4796 RepID=A0A2P4XNW4_9STRA|nr:Hypothetical protein PHPALM_16794 [Phytophthora palmivora]
MSERDVSRLLRTAAKGNYSARLYEDGQHLAALCDEKKWNLDDPDGFQTYWRDIRRPPRQIKRRQAGGGSVMERVGFSAAGKTKLAVLHGKQNSDDYVYTVSKFLLPFVHLHYGANFVYQ